MRTLVVVVTALVACSSHERSTESSGAIAAPFAPKAVALVTRAVGALERANPDDLAAMMTEMIGEIAIEEPACAALFTRYRHLAPSERGAIASEMFTTCRFTCPSAEVFARIGGLRDDQAIATVAGDCDPRHPDPLHGAVLSARDYLVLRNGLERFLDRLEATGTDEAKQDATRLRALLPQVSRPAPAIAPTDAGATAATDAEPAVDAGSGPSGRISIGAKQALDTTSLTADTVLARVQSVYMPALARCYRTQLAADPTARGQIDLAFTVDPRGRATLPTATGVPPVDACVASSMVSWRFPIPNASGAPAPARFTITLQLAPR